MLSSWSRQVLSSWRTRRSIAPMRESVSDMILPSVGCLASPSIGRVDREAVPARRLPAAPLAPGYYIDEAGRGRRDPAERARAVVANEHEHILAFAEWMRDHRPYLPGTRVERDRFATQEVVDFYRWFCWEEAREELVEARLLELFAEAPGIERRRARLNGTADPQLRYIADHFGTARIKLYRVASHEEMEDSLRRLQMPTGHPARGHKTAERAARPNGGASAAASKDGRRADAGAQRQWASEARHEKSRADASAKRRSPEHVRGKPPAIDKAPPRLALAA